jgi:hypothetical protein
MITYYIEFPPIHDDLLNVKFLRVLKYTPLLYVPSMIGLVLYLNYFPYKAEIQDNSAVSYLELVKQ